MIIPMDYQGYIVHFATLSPDDLVKRARMAIAYMDQVSDGDTQTAKAFYDGYGQALENILSLVKPGSPQKIGTLLHDYKNAVMQAEIRLGLCISREATDIVELIADGTLQFDGFGNII